MIKLQFKDGVVFNKTMTQTARNIRTILVYRPFDMVALYDTNVGMFTEVSCSCGWTKWCEHEKQLLHASRLHNSQNNRVLSQTLYDFQAERLSYDKALALLKKQGMGEQRADDWLDRVKE